MEDFHSPAYDVFRGLLKEQREKARLSQEQLGVRIDKPQSWVSKFERGERRIDLIEFLSIAHAIGIDPVKFVRDLEHALAEKPNRLKPKR